MSQIISKTVMPEESLDSAKKRIRKTVELVAEIQQSISGIHQTDARIAFFNFVYELFQTEYMVYSLSNVENTGEFIYALPSEKTQREEEIQHRLLSFDKFIDDSVFLHFFIYMEHYLRHIARSYDGGSCYNEYFGQMVTNLKNKGIISAEDKDLLDIWARVRNTTHNGGMQNKSTNPITYKGYTFSFAIGGANGELDYERKVFLMNEALELMKSIALHPDIQKIVSIPHDYTGITFVKV